MLGRFLSLKNKYFANWVSKRLPLQASVTLNQSRIFIVPTRQGFFLLLLTLLVLLMAINFESALNYALAFWLMSMLWVAVHLTYRNLSGLTVSAGWGNLVEVGDVAEVALLITSGRAQNRGEIEFISDSWGVLTVYMSSELEEVKLPLHARQRGAIRPPRFRIESRFPFGLVVAWSYLEIDIKAWAYPHSVKQARVGVDNASETDPDELSDQFFRQGSEDFHSLKAYAPGDSLRRMHWPSFAQDVLMTKTFTDYQSTDDHIDWDQFPGLSEEERLSAIGYYSERLCGQNQPFSLRLPNVELAPDSGVDHLNRIRRALAEYGHH